MIFSKKDISATGQSDALYNLDGMVEFDEGYFAKETSEKTPLKHGRGSQSKSNIAVMAESTILEDV